MAWPLTCSTWAAAAPVEDGYHVNAFLERELHACGRVIYCKGCALSSAEPTATVRTLSSSFCYLESAPGQIWQREAKKRLEFQCLKINSRANCSRLSKTFPTDQRRRHWVLQSWKKSLGWRGEKRRYWVRGKEWVSTVVTDTEWPSSTDLGSFRFTVMETWCRFEPNTWKRWLFVLSLTAQVCSY